MNAGFKLQKENPRETANCISKLFFGWLIKLLYKGTRRGLEIVDLYKTLDCDRSVKLGDKLERYWEAELLKAKLKNSTPSLLWALYKTFFWSYMIHGLSVFVQMVILRSAQPIILAYLIKMFTKENAPGTTNLMYIYGSALVITALLTAFTYHHATFGQCVVGMRIRIAVSSLVYRKIMRLDQKALGQATAGQVVNLLSNDVNRFDMVTQALHNLWVMPFQIAIVTYFLWQQVGISCLAGVLAMVVFSIPGQGYLGNLTGKLRLKIANKTDHRVKLMSEVISGIQVIKMYAWEKPFEKVIKSARKTEVDDLTTTSYLRGLFTSSMVFIERLTLFLTTMCYVLLGNVITADIVFSIAQFFNILQLAMAIFYPMAISYGAETLITVKRLQEFLVLEEKKESYVESHNKMEIQLVRAAISWAPKYPILKELDLHFFPNSLVAIVGPVGAGKSSLLQVLLGELPPTSGKVYLGGEISYASQEPWLFASSVRNNILFGQPYNKTLYKKVIEVCALEKDLQQFPQGDKTVVGERGVSLSGGQRARINLARAVYRQADIYILDDPLSAVDTHVGKHLFEECIVKYLKGKTRLLVTHQLQYLKKANIIVVINEGKIEAQGTFQELSHSNLNFTKMLVAADESREEAEKNPSEEVVPFDIRRRSVVSVGSAALSESFDISQGNMEVEEESGNQSGISPFREYFKATQNMCVVSILVILLIISQAVCTASDYWVAFWTQQEELRHSNTSTILNSTSANSPVETQIFDIHGKQVNQSQHEYVLNETNHVHSKSLYSSIYDTIVINNSTYDVLKTDVALYLYGSLIIAAIVLTLGRSLLFFKVAMMASKVLHSKMFHSLLEAPMRFFDTNPSGRILNRFSKDMGAIDDILPRVLLEAMQIMLVMCGILVNVGISNPYIIIAIVILGAAFFQIRSWYIDSALDIKHIEGKTKSPVFSHVSSSLNGITTIRASKAEETLVKEFDEHQDTHTSSWYLSISCIVAFGLWLDIICVIFVAVVTYSFIIMHSGSNVSGSLVGLAISQSLILTGMLQHGMRQTADAMNQLTSVVRVLEYTTIEKEGPFDTPPGKLPAIPWPTMGTVEFKNLCLIYIKDDPPVLKNLNFKIFPGEKIGIVGRTGAGKSSLISALFRLAPLKGSILIDGVDTKELGLRDLRKKISIIPQEPVLFSATIRYNLDPFNEFEDAVVWNALEEVELRNSVDSLDFMVSDGGSNFSLGQRQLVCLARAILRKNKILVLDEATANVDHRTDSFIQDTIRRKFKQCTVLTIAHRLNTIMDSDRVLVMDAGSVVEFDHPHNLLQIPDGHFHKMVLETGPTMSLQLKDIAFKAYQIENEVTESQL